MKVLLKLVLTGSAFGYAMIARGELVDAVRSVVHDSVITQQDVEELTHQVLPTLQRQYGSRQDLFEKKLAEAQDDNLQQLVSRQLILHDFKTAGYNLPESVIEDEVQERIKSRYGGDRATLMKTLQAEGLTYEKFRQQIRDQFIVAVLKQKNIASEIIVSPHKVETYYLAHREEFKVQDQVKLRMIVLNKDGKDPDQVRKVANEILFKFKDGASFAEMATIHSEGSEKGGNWPWVETAGLRKELASVAATLKPGQISDVIETTKTDYIMLVEDKRPAHYKSLGEVREQIEKDLVLEERSRLEKQWYEKLKKKTFVKYFY